MPPIFDKGTLVSNFKKKAGIFNKYFAKQCTPLANDSVLPDMGTLLTENKLTNFEIKEGNIEKIIHKSNPKKAHGFDGISIQLLQMCSKEISLPRKLIY